MSTALVVKDEASYLATVRDVRALVERIESVGEAKDLADRARAAQVWAERAKLGQDKVDLAIAARLWAERRAGELLTATVRPRGRNSSGNGSLPEGVTKSQSSRWQRLARVPKREFASITETNIDRGRLKTALQSVGRGKRDETLKRQRATARARARKQLARLGADAYRVVADDVRTWRPTGVACVITDPPYITRDAVELHSVLADFALEVLPAGGALAVMTWQPILPAVLKAMRREELVYRWTAAWLFETAARTPERARRVFDGWKPILVFHKGGWADDATYLYDVVRSPDADKRDHRWAQNVAGFRRLVRAFSEPGELVCDPFAGSGTTGLAALAEDRRFVGCDTDPEAVKAAQLAA